MVFIKVKRPNAVLMDVSGTSARESFIEKVLLPYFRVAAKVYLENNWTSADCRNDVAALKEACKQDTEAPQMDEKAFDKGAQITQIHDYIEYCSNTGRESKAFALFRFHVWFDGYEKGKLSTPVYTDVATQIQRWKNELNIKLYVLSNGWTEATKRFMSKTSHGDLDALMSGHFDTSLGSLTESSTFLKVAELIKENPEDLLFLTKSPEEAKAAKDGGLSVVLVLTHRRNVEWALDSCKDIPIARTFTEIDFCF